MHMLNMVRPVPLFQDNMQPVRCEEHHIWHIERIRSLEDFNEMTGSIGRCSTGYPAECLLHKREQHRHVHHIGTVGIVVKVASLPRPNECLRTHL